MLRTHAAGRLACCLLLACASAPANAAGGSYLVDDASITPNGHCQLESWLTALRHGVFQIATVPACSLHDVEWSVSGIRRAGDDTHATSASLGVKWVAGDLDRDAHAIGLAGGTLWENGRRVSESVYVPASVAFGDDHNWVVHMNIGARHSHEGWQELAGAAIDATLTARWHLIAEYSSVAAAEKVAQVGARCSVTEGADIDMVVGYSHDAVDDRWLTLGLNLGF